MKIHAGQRFNAFTTIRPERIGRHSGWLCLCDCGTQKAVYTSKLTKGLYKSCGCMRSRLLSESATTHGRTKETVPPEYRVWRGIKSRCLNPNHNSFSHYGGRGITISEAWVNDYEAFFLHVGPRPSPLHSIERIDNEGGYHPGNVRWATATEQGANKRNNRVLTINGTPMNIAEASRILGVKYGTLWYRLENGLPLS